MFPHTSTQLSSRPPLVAADGRPISSWGHRQIRLSFSGKSFSHLFLLAGVATPIIGLDFLRDNALLVDTASSRILTSASGELSACKSDFDSAALNTLAAPVQEIVRQFPSVFREATDVWPAASHDVEHSIETAGRPVFAKARLLDPDKKKIAQAEFAELERLGIVR